MVFEKIDKNSWNRKEYFDHYFASVPCTYSMTVKVDITQIKEKGMKLYPAMLYYIAMIVNRHSEFRTAINQDGELGIYDEMIPSYTIFHNDSGIILIHKTDMAGVRTITIQPVNDASGKGFFFVGTVEEKAIVGQILADAIPSIACCFPGLSIWLPFTVCRKPTINEALRDKICAII